MNKKTKEENKKFDWDSYYRNKSNQIPRDTLLKVSEFFKNEKTVRKNLFAIDIGCGHGADTVELLKRGWKVLAIDSDSNGLKLLLQSVIPEWKRKLKTSQQAFESMRLKQCDLINASYCLPFCKPDYFESLWKEIVTSIKTDGRFAGNFFGEKDEWANISTMTFHTKEKTKKLFKDFEIEFFDERDEDGFTSDGEAKHWHVFSVIGRKI